MVSAKLVGVSIVIAITLTAPGWGQAQTCASDADCGKGMRCQSNGIATSPFPTCRSDGSDAGVCTTVDPTTPPPPTLSCQAAPCASDGDCGADMVCQRKTSKICTGGTPVAVDCAPNTACDAGVAIVSPPTCTETVSAACAYRWEVPCNADSDCGAAFTCKPMTSGTCSGSAGSGGSSPGAGGATGTAGAPVPPSVPVDAGATVSVPPPVPVDGGSGVTCTVVSSYPGTCQAKPVACSAATDCPAGWTCSLVGTVTPVGGGPMGTDAGPAVAPPVGVTGTCQAPSTRGTGGTESADTPTIGLSDGGTAKVSDMPPTPTVPTNGGSNQGQQPASTTSGGGCSVGGGFGGALGWGLGGLGVVAAWLSRRRRTR